jgi:hypothetical protein
MSHELKSFIIKIVKFYFLVLILPVLLYYFTRHNLIFDYTAKKYAFEFTRNNLTVSREIAEERKVVYQKIINNNSKHFSNLIIGSSRVMQLGERTGFKNSLNLGVSGANLKDIEIIYNLTRENNITYDTVIFDFNPWLAIRTSDNRYKQFDFYHQLKYAFYDIFTFNYNSEDFITLFGLFNDYKFSFKKASEKDLINHCHFIKLKDGSIQQKKLSASEKNTHIKFFVSELYQMGKFNEIDPLLFKKTVSIYNSASMNGHCLVILSPFHMDLFTKKKNDLRVKNISTIERNLISSRRHFEVFGSFDPKNLSVINSDFLDGLHLKENAIHKLFNR